jgi:DNA-binding XRE family transcriptional regulator
MLELRKIREAAGMTQEQLAEKVGVIRQTISNIECGVALPSIPTAKAIAEVLKFNWTDFFEEEKAESGV